MDVKNTLGSIALAVTFISYMPYLWSVSRGRTKPHAFSWIVWALQTGIICAAQFVEKAGAGAWATGLSTTFCGVIAVLSLWKGQQSVSKNDWILFSSALAALPLWYFTNNPVWSVLLVILIDSLAFVMTIRKAWVLPYEEMATSYLLYGLAQTVSLFAMAQYNFVTVASPVFVVGANVGLAAMIWHRRHTIRSALVEGEQSGPSTPFDFEALIARKRADHRKGST